MVRRWRGRPAACQHKLLVAGYARARQVLAEEPSQLMLRLPAIASDDGDVEEVLARDVGEPIDDGDQIVEADDFDSAPAFVHQLSKARLDALAKVAEMGPDSG